MNSAPLVHPRPISRFFLHFGLGLALGLFFHYLLYRIYLPVEPFIYVAF
jgi:hypothetical protein